MQKWFDKFLTATKRGIMQPYTQPHARAWVEIDAEQLKSNISIIKKTLPETTAFALVIKANAYGHGLKLISQYCEQESLVDFFCVAHLSEALELRSHGVATPILVMCSIDAPLEDAIMQEIDLSVSNIEQLYALENTAKRLQKKAHVHIKIDTGLARFGFFPHQMNELIQMLKQTKHIIVCGIFSHFAQSGAPDQTHANQQRIIFKQCINELIKAGINPQYIHQQNSAGIITQPDPLYNMMRIGALAYGMWSSEFQKQLFSSKQQSAIKQILSFKTRIIEIKELPAHTPVGYNGIFVTQRTTITAKIPVGYADGYFRHFGLGTKPAYVYIRNQYAPIIGHVTMNVITIDVTDITDAQEGDEVLLTGDIDRLRTNDLSTIVGSGNPREVAVYINSTIPRIIK